MNQMNFPKQILMSSIDKALDGKKILLLEMGEVSL